MPKKVKFKDKQPAFEKMQRLSELSAMTKAESDQYFWEQDYYITIKNAEDYEREDREKKRAEILAEGRAEGRVVVVLFSTHDVTSHHDVAK